MVVDPMMALERGALAEDREAETVAVDAGAEILPFRLAAGTDRDPAQTPSTSGKAGKAGRRGRRDHGMAALVGPRLHQLVRTIETDIVPRLVMAQPLPPAAPDVARPLSQADIAAFTAIVLAGGPDEIMAEVEELRAQGVALDRIYLDLFAPTARRLGTMWEEDECDFATVTLALHHLHGLLHNCRVGFAEEPRRIDPERVALLCPVPGEQHVFGIAIVGEFLRHAGWDVTEALPSSRHELARLAEAQAFTLIGLTISREGLLESLTGSIRAIRRASNNRAVGILVGGRIFTERPELVALVGADAAAADGRAAVVQAERLRAHLATPVAPLA